MSLSQPTRLIPAFALLAALAGSGLCVSRAMADDPYPMLKPTLTLDAIIRDFKSVDDPKGHPDFESYLNTAITTALVKDTLDADGKPAWAGRSGMVITKEFKNAAGQNILPQAFGKQLKKAPKADDKGKEDKGKEDKGKDKKNEKGVVTMLTTDILSAAADTGADLTAVSDTAGAMVPSDQSDTGNPYQLTSPESFAQWYRDVPGVNTSKVVPIVFNRVPNTNRYVFDSATDEPYKTRGGFFPIDNELFGNYANWNKNYHFTTEISTSFVYEQGNRQTFTFTGDDDVWVYIGGKLVLDIGGLHPKREQTLEVDRLNLVNGERYELKVFHAERHTTESNFRIETTITMQRAELPQMSNAFD